MKKFLSLSVNSITRALFISGAFLMASTSVAEAGEQEVVQALSARQCQYNSSNLDELAELAGGQDELVSILLKYRTQEKPPFVGIRSEKMLLKFTDRADVLAALEEDVQNPNLFGLARVVSVNIDEVNTTSARERLAKSVVERANREQRFSNYGRLLLNSSDENVQRAARSLK